MGCATQGPLSRDPATTERVIEYNMKFWKIAVSVFFIIIGVLFFIFLRELSDPEVEGDSGRISLGSYFICLIPIIIGVTILFLQKNNKNSN
jgi:hypothetical protein